MSAEGAAQIQRQACGAASALIPSINMIPTSRSGLFHAGPSGLISSTIQKFILAGLCSIRRPRRRAFAMLAAGTDGTHRDPLDREMNRL